MANPPSLYTLVIALGAAGCDQLPLHDLGYTEGDPPPAAESTPAPLPPVAQYAAEFAGVWIGNAEDPMALELNADERPPLFRFASGSSRIRLELALLEADDQYPRGTLTFGDAAPPPPATDPDVGYPVEPELSNPRPAADGSVRPAVEGFAYAVAPDVAAREIAAAGDPLRFNYEGRVADGKLDYVYAPSQVFSSWCALQTAETCPSRLGAGIDDAGQCFFSGDPPVPVECMKMAQCASAVCSCEDGVCTSAYEPRSTLTIRFSNDGLVGLFSGAVFTNERGFQQRLGTVRFQRAAQ